MIQKKYFLIITLLLTFGVNAATLFVTNLLDDGSPGSLRETIATAVSGDTIQFSVSGTILLDESLGELVVDKQLSIDGQDKIVVDGQDQINIGFHIMNAGTAGSADASNTIIQNIAIQNFNGQLANPGSGSALLELPAYGILVDGGAENCSVLNTTIKNISAGLEVAIGIGSVQTIDNITSNIIDNVSSSGNDSTGILVIDIAGDCSNNQISNVVSSGKNSIGILIDNSAGNFFNNQISNVESAVDDSIGVVVRNIDGNCFNNQIDNVQSSGDNSFGLSVVNINGDCSNNQVNNVQSSGNNSIGLLISNGVGNCSSNQINNVQSSSDDSFGLLVSNIVGNCSNNQINNVQSFVGDVYGLTIETIVGNCSNNQISDVFTSDGDSYGIAIGNGFGSQISINGDCSNNQINNVFTLDGRSYGIVIDNETGLAINGSCSDNNISNVSASSISTGIFFFGINITCANNRVRDVSSSSGDSSGIYIFDIDADGLVACNTIQNINGIDETVGLLIQEGSASTISSNVINGIVSASNSASGLILGNNGDTGRVVFDFLVSSNSISNITGSSSDGFGVTILGPQNQSVGNDLLNNSIFNINGKAINIVDNSVPVDAVVTLQSAVCGANKLFIRGSLAPEAGFEDSEFLVQFFASNSNIPPQTMVFVGEAVVQADGTTSFMVEIKTCLTDTTGFITATATAQPSGTQSNNNTSEVSNGVAGCDSSTVCSLFCSPAPVAPVCPIQ